MQPRVAVGVAAFSHGGGQGRRLGNRVERRRENAAALRQKGAALEALEEAEYLAAKKAAGESPAAVSFARREEIARFPPPAPWKRNETPTTRDSREESAKFLIFYFARRARPGGAVGKQGVAL